MKEPENKLHVILRLLVLLILVVALVVVLGTVCLRLGITKGGVLVDLTEISALFEKNKEVFVKN